MPTAPHCRPLGDEAIELLVPRGDEPEALRRALLHAELRGVRDILAGTARIVVHCDPLAAWALDQDAASPFDAIVPHLVHAAQQVAPTATAARTVELPLCCDDDCAPDLADVARRTGLAGDEVIARHLAATYDVGLVGFLPARHLAATYDVGLVGFLPGFAYLHGLDPALALPRRDTPRTHVPAGSVGIADRMTGVYPVASPGGWHLVGRVPLPMFDARADPPARLARGDRVRFVRIDRATFDRLAREHAAQGAAPVASPRHAHAHAHAIHVERPGLLTSVQDAGRWGHHAAGVGQSGWFDDVAPRIANALVGNATDAAVLECTLVGPVLRFVRDALVAITGADMAPALDDHLVPMHRPLRVRAGQRLALGAAVTGCRSYLAIAGGIDVPVVLGSASTHLRAGFGGHEGRALRAGDALATGEPGAVSRAVIADHRAGARTVLDVAPPPEFASHAAGARLGLLPATDAVARTSVRDALGTTWTVQASSDRMGIRLASPRLAHADVGEAGRLPSEPTVCGTVQLPLDGQPIVLGVDRQVTGGYPVLGTVCAASRAALAQLRPGAVAQFVPVTHPRAAVALRERERRVAACCAMIALALTHGAPRSRR
ncbi:MAG: 5-oxoprolinase/urea amidolyase family protein [Gemmatimonadaceae bacterium]|nr:5-oxoprolinase/urea amidolyase family protein [Gemmatimonadaceae bacterium]